MSDSPDENDDTVVGGTGSHPPTSEYPADVLSPTGHLPASGQLPAPPPPRRSRAQTLVVGGSIAAIVLVVAAVVLIVATNRGGGQAGQPTGAPRTSAVPPTTSASTTPATSSTPPPSHTERWHPVAGASSSGLTYSVPQDWANSSKPRSTGRGEQWGGVAEFGTYQCPQGRYTRGFVASGKAPTGDQTDLGALAGDYADALAKHWYGEPRIETGTPQQRQVDGHEAVLVTAKLSIDPENPDCDASSAEVLVLAVKLDRGVGVLAAVNDLEGGPSDPPCAPDGVIQQILSTVKVR
ncbi:hypothetical protein [Labedaea rhizosphaerae]|uniref:DUF8017 domain-containing protein n=1 Tax=Labedaea rhizosphaerae TaxID=598644 RepID=A0A4V6PVX5_LABRH|nr:hypothetical protein [Labedaea rhizosphaerae]TDQ04885.1 hypothetical protein EV186_101846 [Labedaea rhizosphaerae]